MAAPDLPELKIIQVGDYRLSYRELGEGPALLFIHGMGGNSINWESQFQFFSDKFRVIAWDAPGYGSSDDWDHDTPSTGDYALLISDFLNILGVTAAHLVGHSYGGVIVTAFYRSFRERVLSLTLAQPVVGGGVDPLKDRNKVIAAREREVRELGTEGYAKLHAPRSCSPHAEQRVIDRAIEVTKTMRIDGYLTQFRSLRHANIYEWTFRPRVPAMIVGGEEDRTSQKSMIDEIADQMPGIEKHTIPGVGHMFYLENPERFNKILKSFLARQVLI